MSILILLPRSHPPPTPHCEFLPNAAPYWIYSPAMDVMIGLLVEMQLCCIAISRTLIMVCLPEHLDFIEAAESDFPPPLLLKMKRLILWNALVSFAE